MSSESTDNSDRTRRFIELLAKNDRRLSQYVLGLVPNWADADDVIQQAKIRLWEQFDQYDPSKDFGAWACTIAYYLVLSLRKTLAGRHIQLSEQYLEAMSAEMERIRHEQDLRHGALEECLKKLSDASRRLLEVCYTGERTIKEAALTLGRNVGATQKTVYRIRQKLQECVTQRLMREPQQ